LLYVPLRVLNTHGMLTEGLRLIVQLFCFSFFPLLVNLYYSTNCNHNTIWRIIYS